MGDGWLIDVMGIGRVWNCGSGAINGRTAARRPAFGDRFVDKVATANGITSRRFSPGDAMSPSGVPQQFLGHFLHLLDIEIAQDALQDPIVRLDEILQINDPRTSQLFRPSRPDPVDVLQPGWFGWRRSNRR